MMAASIILLMVSSIVISSVLGRSQLIPHEPHPSSELDSYLYCDRDYTCVDCTTARVCAPTTDGQRLYEIQRFTCDSSAPYCNYTSGTCSAILDPTCSPNATVSSNFTCMRDGYFPDPYNCSVYYHCQDEVASQFYCQPPYPFYIPGEEMCVSYNYYCANSTSYNCKYNIPGTKLLLPGYGYKYYIYCGSNRTVTTVDRCIGAYQFDENAQICLPACSYPGLFPKDDDCAKYYKCSPRFHGAYFSSDFDITDMTCPEGQGFSEAEYRCVDRSLAPNCKVPYPDLFNK